MKEYFNYRILCVICLAITIFSLSFAWGIYCTPKNTDWRDESGQTETAPQEESETYMGEDYSKRYVEFDEEGAYLVNGSLEVISKHYPKIESRDICEYSDVVRFIGQNGLIGYLSAKDGGEVTPAIFTEASQMKEGSACVNEGEGYYYISESGERLTEFYYLKAYPFAESQGMFARVMLEDKKWAIINIDGQICIKGLDYVDKLPYVTTIGSAVRNGHALLFDLCEYDKIRLIKEFDEYCEAKVYYGEIAIVKNSEGLYGAINIFGDIIVPVEYRSVDCMELSSHNTFKNIKVFTAQKKDGTYDVFIK